NFILATANVQNSLDGFGHALVFLQQQTRELVQVDRMNRKLQRLRYFADSHTIQHDLVIALQHLPRYQNKFAFESLARRQQIASSQQSSDRYVAAKVTILNRLDNEPATKSIV